MTEPRQSGFLRRRRELGGEVTLVKETEWMRVYELGPKLLHYESKFLTEGLQLSAAIFEVKWRAMTPSEGLAFANAYATKPDFTAEDERIIDIILEDGEEVIWISLTLFMLQHTDRKRIVDFMIARLERQPEESTNFIQALGIAKAQSAMPLLRARLKGLGEALSFERTDGIPADVVFGPIPYSAYFVCCNALWQITGSKEYEDILRNYLSHPNSQVRAWAGNHLGIDTRTDEERKRFKKEWGLES
jgi:hypothetical protein